MKEIDAVIAISAILFVIVTLVNLEEIKDGLSNIGKMFCDIVMYPLRRRKREKELEEKWMENIEQQKKTLIKEVMAEVGKQMRIEEKYSTEEMGKALKDFAEYQCKERQQKEVKDTWKEHIMERFMRMD